MFAIVKSKGRQYRVREGQQIRLPRHDQAPGEELVLDSVLAVGQEDDTRVGSPYVQDARVICDVLEHGRGKKIIVFKKKKRKGYSKKQGHRQDFTAVKVRSIEA